MKRKPKTARPAPESFNPADLLCFAAPDAPAVDIDAHIARSQRRCIDCGGAIAWEREGVLCDACDATEQERIA